MVCGGRAVGGMGDNTPKKEQHHIFLLENEKYIMDVMHAITHANTIIENYYDFVQVVYKLLILSVNA